MLQRHVASKTEMKGHRHHLSHDFQGPAVPHADWLGGVSRDLAVLLRRPQQGGAKHRGQVVEGHLVDALLLCHPEEKNTDSVW